MLAFSAARRGQAVRGKSPVCQKLGLQTGDLLMPGGDLARHPALPLDGSQLRKDRPSKLVFFRATAGLLSMEPAWACVPGFELPTSVRLDVMHIKDLGVTARWVAHCFQLLIDAKVWTPTGTAIATDLQRFYRSGDRLARDNGRRILSRLPKGTGVGLLVGKPPDRLCKGKASENRDLVSFLVAKLQNTADALPGRRIWILSGLDLLETFRVLQQEKTRYLPRDVGLAYLRAETRFLRRWRLLKMHTTIKHHMCIHLAEQALQHETHPAFFDTFRDETLNRSVKRWAHGVHTSAAARLTLSRAMYMRDAAARPRAALPTGNPAGV
jgi:hypothetical protein